VSDFQTSSEDFLPVLAASRKIKIPMGSPSGTENSQAADGFLFPPDDLIRSVLDLTLELEKLGVIEIHLQPNGAHFYRIISQKKPTHVPKQLTTEIAKRVATIFRRRASTLWNAEEIKAFRSLAIDPNDLAIVEEHYKSEAKNPESYCRTSLLTFLRHYPGEVDRAKRWKATVHRRHCY
jgi:hypothetical protein